MVLRGIQKIFPGPVMERVNYHFLGYSFSMQLPSHCTGILYRHRVFSRPLPRLELRSPHTTAALCFTATAAAALVYVNVSRDDSSSPKSFVARGG